MSHIDTAIQYCEDVKTGKVPACEYVKKACLRFEVFLFRALREDGIWFDAVAAERVCDTLEKYPHVKGKWAAKKETLVLSPWQTFCTIQIFGFKLIKNGEKVNLRMIREAYIEVPRKNGKTFWVAGIGLIMLTEDGEFGAEVYCGAGSEKQANEVFIPAKRICEREPDLRAHYGLQVNAKSLTIEANGSKFEPIIGNPGDGSSPSCAIADEFHEHPTDNQVDTMVTGMGARDQPLMIYITTAGADTASPCYDKRDDVINVLNGTVEDDSIFGIIYTLDESDAWDTVEAQKKANPNFGISVSEDYLKGQLLKARRSATKQVSYKTKHLNRWVGAKAAWMNMLSFQACRRKRLKFEDYLGYKAFAAFDLASKIDIASRVFVFPAQNGKKVAVFCRHYVPEDVVFDENNPAYNKVYQAWHANGWLETTPGNVIDFEYIENDLLEDAKRFELLEVPFDPYQATEFSTRMQAQGLKMIEVGATVKNFSEPMKELEKMILEKSIEFEYDPVLMWMFGNVVAKVDQKENIFPNKPKPAAKIDGVVALIMAVNRMITMQDSGNLDEYLRSMASQ